MPIFNKVWDCGAFGISNITLQDVKFAGLLKRKPRTSYKVSAIV
jgi:hypothetical protein